MVDECLKLHDLFLNYRSVSTKVISCLLIT